MERNHLFRCRIFTEGILLVYLTLLCFNELLRNLHIAAAPTQRHTKLFLLNDSMEVEIQTPWDDREREFESPEVTLGRNQLEEIKNELPVTSKEVKESHSNAIQERSAPDKCKFLKKIGDMSLKGAPTFSLAILPKNVVIIIQSYPKNESLRYLCANGTLSADPANFSSAESSCSLRNITKVNLDYFSNISISDPCWIQSETIDREALLFYNYEMSTEEGSCYKINREEKTTTAATDLFLRKTIRFTSFQNFSVQIKPCCDVSSTADSTTVDPGTTPKGKQHHPTVITTTKSTDNSKAGNAIKILLIFIGAIFAVLCLFFLCCKFCCTPKRRPSYKVEYADPSDVIASSSGAEYSTPYDTCKARNKVVKVTAKAKGAGKNKVSLRKKLSQRFSSSRPRGRRRDNDSGFSDLLESDVSKVSGKEDQMESKEAQYMEIPLTNLNVTKSLSNPSYTLVDGKPNGRGDNDKKESGVRFTLPMSGLKEKQKLCSTSQRQENADAPYESLPDKYKSNEACKMSTEETNLTENPYAVPDCDKKSPTPSKPPETDKSRDSPYSEIKHVFSIEGDTKVKRFIKAMGEGENPYM